MGGFGDGGWPDGRYVMVGQDSGSVAVISDPLSDVEPKPKDWLNKDFFKVEKPRSISVTYPDATNSWKVTRETESGDWKLADAKDNENLDTSKASSFSYALSSPSFNDVAVGATPEQSGLGEPTVIRMETFDGFQYALNVGNEKDSSRYMIVSVSADLPKERMAGPDEKPEDKERLDKEFAESQKTLQEKLAREKSFEKWTYLVSSGTVDSLLKDRHEMLAEKETEEPAESETGTNSTGIPEAEGGSVANEGVPADEAVQETAN
jgi:hypothetical protein